MKQQSDSNKMGNLFQRLIPMRFLFVIMSLFGFFLVYAYKVVVPMSIVTMVNSTTGTEQNNPTSNYSIFDTDKGYCPANNIEHVTNITTTTTGHGEFNWDDTVKSQVLGAFFYGYVLTQFPAGILASRFGGKLMFGTSLFVSALLSLVSPPAARYDYRLFMAVRIGQGLVEGAVFPAMSVMISNWMPQMERSRGTTLIFIGAQFGTVLTLPITSVLCNSDLMGGWPSTYYLLGIVGIVWYALWLVLVYESPEVHPYILEKERQYILDNGGGVQTAENYSVPYREIFTSVPVYALIFCNFGQNWAFLTILNLMPTYMNDILHTTETQKTIVSGLPYLGQALFGWIMSWITDKIRQTERFEITTLRKFNCFIAYFPTAICIMLIPMVGCNTTISCLMFILTIALNGASIPGFASTHVDMSPDFSGILVGLSNGIGNIPGFLTTIVASQITKNRKTVHSWSYVFYIAAVINALTGLVYCVFASAAQQPWGTRKQLEERRLQQQQIQQAEIKEINLENKFHYLSDQDLER